MEQNNLEVLIIGAGPTGLLLAQGLKRHNIKATIFERETPQSYYDRPREWGMSLHWGQEAINKILPSDLQSRIREVWCNPYYEGDEQGIILSNYAGHSGELLFEIPMPKGSMRVSRRKMRKLFSEGLEVEYGKRIISITQDSNTVTASFKDGTQATGSVLIGCDGAKSIVRQLLVGPERARNKDLEFNLINFPCSFDAETTKLIIDKNPIFFNSHHENGFMFWVSAMDVPDPNNLESMLWQIQLYWSGPPARKDFADQKARMEYLKDRAPEFAEPWRTIIKAIPEDVKFDIDHIAVWEPVDWSIMPLASKVTLAGDAAHPMPPYRGQGLQNGLQDASALVDLLTTAGPSPSERTAAVRSYEPEMRERSTTEIAVSTMAARLAHDFDQLLNSPAVSLGVGKSRKEDVQNGSH